MYGIMIQGSTGGYATVSIDSIDNSTGMDGHTFDSMITNLVEQIMNSDLVTTVCTGTITARISIPETRIINV